MFSIFSTKFFIGVLVFALLGAMLLLMVSKILPLHDEEYFASLPQATMTIHNNTMHLVIVDTVVARTRGLSNIQELPQNTGMLFVFERSDLYPFWMKDMQFPIDIIWLDAAMTIVDITKNITPETYPETFVSKVPAQNIIECTAGCAYFYQFTLGEQLSIVRE